MFRKIEIWVLYLFILLSIPFAVGFGVLVRQELVGKISAGWISKSALTLAEIPANINKLLTEKHDQKLTVEDRFPTQSGFVGSPNDQESYLLLSRYDGDLNEGIVELVDLSNFEVLHTWNPDINAINKLIEPVGEFKYINRDKLNSRNIIIHPKLTADGGLIFHDQTPLRKIDACSKLVFQNTKDNFHHTIETDSDGNLWVPSYIYPQTLPSEKVGRAIGQDGGFWEDAIVKLSPAGDILYEKSIAQIFIENDLEYLLFSVGDQLFVKDPIHTNDIQPVNVDSKYWKKGDVFLSLRHQSMVLLYRPSSNKIIWKGTGKFFHQHDVDILDDHRISIFNNNSKDYVGGNVVDGVNEIVIYDFETNEYSFYLTNSLEANEVRTITQGRSEILSNGDLFVEESNYSRTLYFNSDGTLRWSHVNRAGDNTVFLVGWSRILYRKEDINIVSDFINSKGACNE